ncbi:cytochrome-c peroxidase [Marinospirillum perlucidum]|uniref:cytochrome-c peroxidase n=1 Tax=Marinospirillum perlucidum TaxID=1982602 RepID=UPI000DF1C55F|nr:cytochrome c peroxidase [Marinospirillum perlucidum]
MAVTTCKARLFGRGLLLALVLAGTQVSASDPDQEAKARLGQQLFFDPILSQDRTQSCATCHVPDQGFMDARDNGVAGSASLGDDGHSLGNRNTPSAGYAALTPEFHLKANGEYAGGLFWDGRANSLAEQAMGPPLNPVEMALPDAATAAERLLEKEHYRQQFAQLYGEAVSEDPQALYEAMADAIAAFEETDFFAPFDSRYDRYLRGEVEFTQQEELGRTLFFSQQFTNCNSCHQLHTSPRAERETFSNYEFHNIGVPANQQLNAARNSDAVDTGLFQHPQIDDPEHKGKFKTPSLRNVAVTGPYMHNGVFQDLRTVVLFYNQYNSRSPARQINPETGENWAAPEVPQNLSLDLLESGPALDDRRIDALVAFLKTLTDQRYEQLLPES